MYVHVYIYEGIYVYIYTCIYVYIYMYIILQGSDKGCLPNDKGGKIY